MSRLMNGLLEGNGRTNQAWAPAVDVWETENEIVYAFDLPGIPEDKISRREARGAEASPDPGRVRLAGDDRGLEDRRAV